MPEHSIATRKITRRIKHNFEPGVTRCMIRLITMVCCVRGVALPRRGPQCRRALVRRGEGCRCHCSLKHILSLESGTLFLSPSQSSSLLLPPHHLFSALALFRSSSSTNFHSNSLQCSLRIRYYYRIPNIAYSVLLANRGKTLTSIGPSGCLRLLCLSQPAVASCVITGTIQGNLKLLCCCMYF